MQRPIVKCAARSPWPPAHASSPKPPSTRCQQPQNARPLHNLFARAGVELGEQVLHVPLDRRLADLHRKTDLLVRQVARQQFQYLALLGRQRHARRQALALRFGERGVVTGRDLAARAIAPEFVE